MPDELNISSSQNVPPADEQTIIRGDKINVGDIYGTYVAIGKGAEIIVNHINHALSTAEEAEKQHEVESHILARAVIDYVEKLHSQLLKADPSQPGAEPYKSLFPYRLADAPFFFGRKQAKQDLLTNMSSTTRGRLTVLHSESGAGKTSLLQAGLAAEGRCGVTKRSAPDGVARSRSPSRYPREKCLP